MELPKHTTQVGTIAANKKLYLEDYCISYMKQLTEEFPEDRKQIALFGIVQKEKNVEYAFAYGAALLGKGRGRTDSLTNSQKEEAESFRTAFFQDYQLIGVVISTDAVNENIFWLGYGNKAIPMDGYYIFYDTNEAMLNFMMENQKEERDIDLDPVIIKKADMDREKREKAAKEKLEAEQKSGKYRKSIRNAEKPAKLGPNKNRSPFPMVACLLLLGICGAYGVKTYYPEFGLEQAKMYFDELRGKTSIFANSYLSDEDTETESVLMVETSSETSAETEELVIVSADVEPPAEMDVVIIPELETVENSEKPEAPVSEPVNSEPVKEESVPSEAAPVENEKAAREYFIQKGDNLLKILRTYYGDESKLKEVCDLNGIIDPNNIQVGQTILLP